MFAEYVRNGWKLCHIPLGRKAPAGEGWNHFSKALTENRARLLEQGGEGVGLMHALSGTCCLDIDHMEKATAWLAARGVDLAALLAAHDAVHIRSGRPGRDKLLYRLPTPLRTIKPMVAKESQGIELRCATIAGASVQDVLPPSIHPDTKLPYQWDYDELVADWRDPPLIPDALRRVWEEAAGASAAAADGGEAPRTPEIERLRPLIADKDPAGMPYDGKGSWLEIGMVLHHETGGSRAGLQLWNEWSSQDRGRCKDGSARYKGIDDLKVHWVSFKSEKGKAVVTAKILGAEDTARDEEFETLVEPPPKTSAPADAGTATTARKVALSILEEKLVYVRGVERYFDIDYRKLLNTDSAIQNLYTHFMPRKNGAKIDPVKMLKESKTKRLVDGLGFHPGAPAIFTEHGETYANEYRPLVVEPLEPTAEERATIEWLFDRIDDTVFKKWLLQFYGHVVQKPGIKIRSAPILWSEIKGNGKSTIAKTIPALLVGRRYSKDASSQILTTTFDDVVVAAWHVHVPELRSGTRAERNAIGNKLKPWLSDDIIPVHPKGRPAYSMTNHFFVTFTSQHPDAAPIDDQERRYGVHEYNPPKLTLEERTRLFADFLSAPRAAGVLRHYFLAVDLTGFSPDAPAPITQSHRDMAAATIAADEESLKWAFDAREGIFARDAVKVTDIRELLRRETHFTPSGEHIGRLLRKPPFNGIGRRVRDGLDRHPVVIVRNHAKWEDAEGWKVMKHINGDDADLAVDDSDEDLIG